MSQAVWSNKNVQVVPLTGAMKVVSMYNKLSLVHIFFYVVLLSMCLTLFVMHFEIFLFYVAHATVLKWKHLCWWTMDV